MATISKGLLRCPRCGAELSETKVSGWCVYWSCDDCMMAFHFEDGRLTPGRTQEQI